MGMFATPRAKWRGRLPCARHVLDRFGRPPSKTRPKQNGPSSPASFSLARAAFWPLAGGTSLFPAKREVKREVAKAWQAWPRNQTSCRCLVRSLVSLAGCLPHLHASRPCPLQPWVGAVGVRGTSVRTRLCPQGCLAQGPTPRNRSEKKSAENSIAPSLPKVYENDCFRVCRGL